MVLLPSSCNALLALVLVAGPAAVLAQLHSSDNVIISALPPSTGYHHGGQPTHKPVAPPTYKPTNKLTYMPTAEHTHMPSYKPTTAKPSAAPTYTPTHKPTTATYKPTYKPTYPPTYQQTAEPTNKPTYKPAVAKPTTTNNKQSYAAEYQPPTTNHHYSCIQKCVLVNLVTYQEQELQAGDDHDNWYDVLSSSVHNDGQHRYSIRCDSSSAVSFVTFAYYDHEHDDDNVQHTEFKTPYWMNGDYQNHCARRYGRPIVNDVPYLQSCGAKTVTIWAMTAVTVDDDEWDNNDECFRQTYQLTAKCNDGSDTTHRRRAKLRRAAQH
jgi:L-rhamnose mutarotase